MTMPDNKELIENIKHSLDRRIKITRVILDEKGRELGRIYRGSVEVRDVNEEKKS
jgi:hypothetical protein